LTLLDFDDSLKDDFDDSDRKNDVTGDDDVDDINDSNMEEHDNTYEEEDYGDDGDIPLLLLLLKHSRALLAEGGEGLKVGPDLLPELLLVREHDSRHAVGLVTLALVSAG